MDLVAFFGNFSPVLATFLLATLPLTELRGSIPIAIFYYQMPPWSAFLWSVLGNLVPGYLILTLINPVSDFLRKHWQLAAKFLDWWFNKVYRKFFSKYNKYGEIALIIFVAIPLPVTGVWTGAVAAWLFKISKKRALPYIAVGAIISGIIVTTLSAGVNWWLNI